MLQILEKKNSSSGFHYAAPDENFCFRGINLEGWLLIINGVNAVPSDEGKVISANTESSYF